MTEWDVCGDDDEDGNDGVCDDLCLLEDLHSPNVLRLPGSSPNHLLRRPESSPNHLLRLPESILNLLRLYRPCWFY